MKLKTCSVTGCRNTKIVGMQREIKLATRILKKTDQQLSQNSTIVYKLFCEDHLNLKERENINLVPSLSVFTGADKHQTNDSSSQAKQMKTNSISTMLPLNKVSNSDDNSNSNRKRKADSPSTQTKQIKINDNEKSYVLNGVTISKVNVMPEKFASEKKDSGSDASVEDNDSKVNVMPEKFASEKKDSGSDASVEDNDCFITNEQSTNIIDLSADDNADEKDTSKMIELILSNENETEPESEEIKEYLVEIIDDEDGSPVNLDFLFAQAEDVVSQSVDLTTEQDDDNAAPEQKNQNTDREENSNSVDRDMMTIDLTSDDEAYMPTINSMTEVIEEIRLNLNRKYPESINSVSWNTETKQFEVGVRKKDGFKLVPEFHQYVREVVDEAIQLKGSAVENSDLDSRETKTKSPVTENVILNKDHALKQLKPLSNSTEKSSSNSDTSRHALKQLKTLSTSTEKSSSKSDTSRHALEQLKPLSNSTEKSSSNSDTSRHALEQLKTLSTSTENSSSNSDTSRHALEQLKTLSSKTIKDRPVDTSTEKSSSNSETSLPCSASSTNSNVSSKIEIVSNYNANQILKKSETYLGVTATTFEHIEKQMTGRFKNRPLLILVLRKLKLNESFSLLSDVLYPNKADCISTYEEFLSEVSRTLHGFLRWPISIHKTLAIVDVFEIEIKKPNCSLEQIVSFCSQKQRYLVKFIICCTSTGYIIHVSKPFYSIQRETLISNISTIPKCASIVVNPSLFSFGKKGKKDVDTRMNSLFDDNRQSERKVIRRVFDRLREFSLINCALDLEKMNLLQQTMSLISCLCNLEYAK